MKIKEVCERTQLNERTIRYYVEKELIAPDAELINGRTYLNYSEENIEQLLDIAELRKLDFSIGDIIEMQDYPQEIEAVISRHHKELLQKVEKKNNIIKVIEQIKYDKALNVTQLVKGFSELSQQYGLPQADINPDFSKFDHESKEEKEAAYSNFLVSHRKREKRHQFLSPILKGAGLLVCLFILTIAVIAVSGIPRSIDLDYATVQYRVDDETYVEHSQMKITGKLYKRLLSNPKFVGSIIIDNFDVTKTHQLFEITFKQSIFNGSGSLTYGTVENGRTYIDSIGTIWMSNNFEDITVWVLEPIGSDSKSGQADEALIIAAPTKSREVAIYEFMQYFSPK